MPILAGHSATAAATTQNADLVDQPATATADRVDHSATAATLPSA